MVQITNNRISSQSLHWWHILIAGGADTADQLSIILNCYSDKIFP